jgi:hypothetical protein
MELGFGKYFNCEINKGVLTSKYNKPIRKCCIPKSIENIYIHIFVPDKHCCCYNIKQCSKRIIPKKYKKCITITGKCH